MRRNRTALSVDANSAPAVRKSVGHYLRTWLPTVAVLALLGLLISNLAQNKALQWSEVGKYFFNSQVLEGVLGTLELTVICTVLGGIIGVVLAAMRMSGQAALTALAYGYSWIVRSVPPLVQLIFWFNLALILPALWWPFTASGSVPTNTVISGFTAAVIGLSLNEAAYFAEIIRGGIISVSVGEIEAARALGMRSGQIFRHVTLPQALRVALPPIGNQVIALTKLTTLVAFIGGSDLMSKVTAIYGTNYEVVPLLIVASLWYLAIVSVLSILQTLVDRRWFKRTSSATGAVRRNARTAVAAGRGSEEEPR